MKTLLTGAGGFLGKQIAESLLAQGVTDLRLHFRQKPPIGLIEELKQRHPDANIDWVGASLLARGRLNELVTGVDCVIHAAAGMKGAVADMFANTVLGTRNLLEVAATHGVRRVVLISSFSVYRTDGMVSGAVHDESVPLETVGVDKGPYGYCKTRQEQLFYEMQREHGFEAVVLRPGVIYGPGGSAISPRVGLNVFGLFFSLGGGAQLPLTYVNNCADAIACAALKGPAGSVYNVVDDDVPTCREYLQEYRRRVRSVRTLIVPRWALLLGSRVLVWYNRKSKGQLPAVFTPYVVKSMYTPLRYSNAALHRLGWTQAVPTSEGLSNTFQYLRDQADRAVL
jgi:nucleoside-diphosphate-sugar epimerase